MKSLIAGLFLVILPFHLFGGGAAEEPDKPGKAGTGGMAMVSGKYSEAPMLAELVKAGKLPPVDKRLPKNPVVVRVESQVGKYGGTMTTSVASRHRAINSVLAGRFVDDCPFTWNKLGTELIPNWVEKGILSADGMTYTIRLREGIKWSDGVPVTTEDLLFSYVDIAANKEINPEGIDWLKGVSLQAVDDLEFKFKLSGPAPLFEYTFQTAEIGMRQPIVAKHYFKQFHPNYANKEELAKAAKAAGVNTWVEYFDLKAQNDNPDRPNLSLWVLKEATTETVVVERNPYFWKVDEKGNQLPYIDRMRIEIVSSPDVYTMKGLAGQLDIIFYGIKYSDYPTLKSNEKSGDYKIYSWNSAEGKTVLTFNQNYKDDEQIASLLRTPDFKKALAYSINRGEIKELVHLGQGNAVVVSPPEGSPIFKPEYPKMYSEYDPAKAKGLLDTLRLKDANGDGWREKPNGQSLLLELIIHADEPDHVSTGELLKAYWEAVGLKTRLNVMPQDRRQALAASGNYQMNMDDLDIILYPLFFRTDLGPLGPFLNFPWQLAHDWDKWVQSKGAEGEKPSAEYLETWTLFNSIISETDVEKRKSLAMKLFDNYYRNIWTLGIMQQLPRLVMISNRVKNVPMDVVEAWPLRTPSNALLCQWYLEK